MADETGGNGRVSFTTKELLERIDTKLDVLDAKLDQKADRARVHELANAINASEGRTLEHLRSLTGRLATLESTALLREGPFVDEFRDYEGRLRALESERAVAKALLSDKTSRFTRAEKVVMGGLALVTLLANLVYVGLYVVFH